MSVAILDTKLFKNIAFGINAHQWKIRIFSLHHTALIMNSAH
jgi:hypothetical protein